MLTRNDGPAPTPPSDCDLGRGSNGGDSGSRGGSGGEERQHPGGVRRRRAPTSCSAEPASAPAPSPALLPPGRAVELKFTRMISDGSDGTVIEGTCGPEPAVIKLFSGSREGKDAYRREAGAYCALTSLQGSVVPYMLSYGPLPMGMHYVAMRPVSGRPCAGLKRSDAVCSAALRSLEAVRRCCPGFVHGDIRLENLLLLDGEESEAGVAGPQDADQSAPPGGGGGGSGASGSGAAAGGQGASGGGQGASGSVQGASGGVRVLLLDFARSWRDTGSTGREQERELAELRRLLSPAGGRRKARR